MRTPRVFGKCSLPVALPLISGEVRVQDGWCQAPAGRTCSSTEALLGAGVLVPVAGVPGGARPGDGPLWVIRTLGVSRRQGQDTL